MSNVKMVKLAEDDRLYATVLLMLAIEQGKDDFMDVNDIVTVMGTKHQKTDLRITMEKELERYIDANKRIDQYLTGLVATFLVIDPDAELDTKPYKKCFVVTFSYDVFRNIHNAIESGNEYVTNSMKIMWDKMKYELNHPELISKGGIL